MAKKPWWWMMCMLGGFVLGMMPSGGGLLAQKAALRTLIIDPGHGGADPGAQGARTTEGILALQLSLKVRDLMKKELPDLTVLMTRERDELAGGYTSMAQKNASLRYAADFANRNNGDLFISIHLNSSPGNQKYGRRQVGTREETYYVYQGKGKARKKVAKTRTVPVYERYRIEPSVYGTQTYVLASDWYKGKVAAVGRQAAIYESAAADSLDSEMDLDPVEARIRAQHYTRYYFQKSLTMANYVEEEFGQQGRRSWGVWQRDWKNAAGIWVLQATQMPSILIESGYIDYPDEEAYLMSAKGQEEFARAVVNAVKRYKQLLENPESAIANREGATNTGGQ